jgi:hypothetical protein
MPKVELTGRWWQRAWPYPPTGRAAPRRRETIDVYKHLGLDWIDYDDLLDVLSAEGVIRWANPYPLEQDARVVVSRAAMTIIKRAAQFDMWPTLSDPLRRILGQDALVDRR